MTGTRTILEAKNHTGEIAGHPPFCQDVLSIPSASGIHIHAFADTQMSSHEAESAHSSSESSSRTTLKECWMCRSSTETNANPIISGVCHCTGTIGSVHQACIDRWVLKHSRPKCHSCDTVYRIEYRCCHPAPVPETFVRKLGLVLWHYLLPLLRRVAYLAGGVSLMWIAVPVIIGLAHYGDSSWLRSPRSVGWRQQLEGFVFGFILVSFYRSARQGWEKWLAFFAEGANDISPFSDAAGDEVDAHDAENGDGNTPFMAAPPQGTPETQSSDEDTSEDEDVSSEEVVDGFVAHAFLHVHEAMTLCGVSRAMWVKMILELRSLISLAAVMRLPYFFCLILPMGIVTGAVMLRAMRPLNRLKDPRRRWEEGVERRKNATPNDIWWWYVTYLLELILFSCSMPLLAGVTLRYSVAPFLLSAPSLSELLQGMTVLHAVAYWSLGTACSALLLFTESSIMIPLFAPGVNLFFARSIDGRDEIENHYWCVVFHQLCDADPLRMIQDFVFVTFAELLALYAFVSLPLRSTFGLREWLFGDISTGRLSLPRPSGLSPWSGALDDVGGPDPLARWAIEQVVELLGCDAILLTVKGASAAPLTLTSELLLSVAAARNDTTAVRALEAAAMLPSMSQQLVPLLKVWGGAGVIASAMLLLTANRFLQALQLEHSVISMGGDEDHDWLVAYLPESSSSASRLAEVAHVVCPDRDRTPTATVSYSEPMGVMVSTLVLGTHHIPLVDAVGRWVAQWLLSYPQLVTAASLAVTAAMALTVVFCFLRYPIQRLQLRVLRPIVVRLGRVMGLHTFLFDPERLELLNELLDTPDQDIDMPTVPLRQLLMRRERLLNADQIPQCLPLRLLLFAALFFGIGCAVLWVVPVLLMVIFLTLPVSSCFMILLPWCCVFTVWDPLRFAENILLALAAPLLLACSVFSQLVEGLSAFLCRPSRMVMETWMHKCGAHRKVGRLDGPPETDHDVTAAMDAFVHHARDTRAAMGAGMD